ncbi:prepilin-type N-terminal cleavage/methylation domain-containing protein [Parvularcula lutaonensis]|uniref:Type II secretion system protein n=1 Tax=Parvularcula lutaonensis TaxID=491923 RepID=A0ABV7MDK4_9PROT|nr:prepilin-type N-terminal cleavage/methylation domain-containing protein [Parvularcula lutaonensis]GGY52713.1 hypothetical protein GCM10007148_22420 [Parvularcula lutaonensis]
MPISAPGRTEAGLTLVELLVVMLIIGMTAGIVIFAVPRGQSDLAKASLQVERDIAALREAAVAEVALYGVRTMPRGYVLYKAEEGAWSELAVRELPRSVDLELKPEGGWELEEHRGEIPLGIPPADDDDAPKEPEVVFGPEGSVTPFSVKLSDGRRDAEIRVGPFGELVEEGDA